jgi:hypothetical protein
MKESAFSKLLKPHLPGDTTRIETGSTECGVPDISGTWVGNDYWSEQKVCDNKTKLRDVTTLLRPEQKVWHLARAKQGATIFVCVKYCFGIALYRCFPPEKGENITVSHYACQAVLDTYKSVGETIRYFLAIKDGGSYDPSRHC